jgi:hypothetical protein
LLQQETANVGAFTDACSTLSDPEKRTPAGLTCNITGLETAAKYMVRVIAHNFVGESYPSPPALLALFDAGHGIPPTPTQPFISFADTSSVLVRWTPDVVSGTGTAEAVTGYDVGVAAVPAERVRQLVALDQTYLAMKRSHASNAVQLSTHGDRLQRSVNVAQDSNLTEAGVDVNMQDLLADLDYTHVYRGPSDEDAQWFRAEGLNAGGAYAFKVRGLDGESVGEWSEAVFVALSPDVPLAPPAPVLVQAHENNLTVSIAPGHNQGSPVLWTLVEMVVIEGAGGRFSQPRPVANFSGDGVNGSYLLTVDEIPPNTPFGFRAASANAMGQGDYGKLSYFSTRQAPLVKPLPPEVVRSASREVSVRFAVPDLPKRAGRHAAQPVGPMPATEVVNDRPSHLLVSGTDFLFATHQLLDGPSPLETRYHMVANIAEDRSFKTVCNVTKPGCSVDHLRAHTSFVMKVRTIAAWGASPWSDLASTQTDASYPDAPLEPEIEVNHETGRLQLSWFPPESNGFPLTGFDVLLGVVPKKYAQVLQNVVSTTLPPQRFTVPSTDNLKPYFSASKVKGLRPPPPGAPKDETVGGDLQELLSSGRVVLAPNEMSPEALVTSLILPPPPGFKVRDIEETENSAAADIFTPYLSVAASNITTLSFSSQLPAPAEGDSALYVARVRARNKRGYGPPSPITRFFSSPSTDALPPNQPRPPMVARAAKSYLELEWEAPEGNGAVVSTYILRMLVGELTDETSTAFQDVYTGGDLSFRVDGLVPDKMYHFYLVAHNAIGVSPPSNLVRAHTPSV